MDETRPSSQHLLATLERLLEIPTADLRTALTHATDLLAATLHADKVDVFLYDSTRDSLNAICSSNQPLSALQRKLGLDILPLSNGGRVVWVYKTGRTFITGRLQDDAEELRGVKEGLGIQSKLGVPFEMGGKRRGMVMLASLEANHFTQEDVNSAETLVRWIGLLAHRVELAEETRRNSEEQSRRATADELVAVVAHDVRNYLAPIEVRLQTLRLMATRKSPPEQMLTEIDRIFNSMGQLRSLIGDLLDVARIDHGLFRVQPALFDLVDLVQDSAQALATADKTIDVRVRSTGQILIVADAVRIRQCIGNLIVNAMEQTPSGGTVRVELSTETRPDSEYALAQVIDEGPGVAPEILPRIFERHSTSKGRDGGLGLGLFLAKCIADIHGGKLTVESQPGQGARFVLSLPCQVRAG